MKQYLDELITALVKEEEEDQQQLFQQQSQLQQSSLDPEFTGASAKDFIKLEGSITGPCFENLLRMNVIDRLCAIGLPDVRSVVD